MEINDDFDNETSAQLFSFKPEKPLTANETSSIQPSHLITPRPLEFKVHTDPIESQTDLWKIYNINTE